MIACQSQSKNLKLKNLKFEISDTGIGIDHTQLADIFEPFQQVGESRYSSEGTGLGLAISRKMVSMLGSELQVTSTPGVGSCFSFTLNVTKVDDVQPRVVVPERRIIGYKGPQKRILVVDDRRENRGVVVNALLPLGFTVLEAENGHECIEQVYRTHLDAILLDMRMPLMDGFETARYIRKQQPVQAIPIIAISASVYDEIRTRSLEAGCNMFLTKPLHLDDLLSALQSMLALEWIYSEEEPDTNDEPPTPAHCSSDVGMSAGDIADIVELAKKGRAKKLLAYFEKLEEQHPEYQPVLDELREYVKRFRFKQLTERVHSLKETP